MSLCVVGLLYESVEMYLVRVFVLVRSVDGRLAYSTKMFVWVL